jgi:hypothetical protein
MNVEGELSQSLILIEWLQANIFFSLLQKVKRFE